MKKQLLSLALMACTTAFAQVPGAPPPKMPGKEERLKHVSEHFGKELNLTRG